MTIKMGNSRSEKRDELKRTTILFALLLLLPAFQAVPAFVTGILLARNRVFQRIPEALLWTLTVLTACCNWLIYGPTFVGLFVRPGNLRLSEIAPLVASGLPAGLLWAKEKPTRWLAILIISASTALLWLLLARLLWIGHGFA